jgi:DNA-binding response OmpR family regulator
MGGSERIERMHILVVDHDETVRKLVRETFTITRGAKVIEAEDAKGGLRQLKAHPETTLIVCDWDLAGMSGIDFVEQGRSMTSTVRFLATSKRPDRASVMAAQSAGIRAFLVKPISAQDLIAKVAVLARANP